MPVKRRAHAITRDDYSVLIAFSCLQLNALSPPSAFRSIALCTQVDNTALGNFNKCTP